MKRNSRPELVWDVKTRCLPAAVIRRSKYFLSGIELLLIAYESHKVIGP